MTGESSAIYSHGKAVAHLTSRDVSSKKPPLQRWRLSITPLSTTHKHTKNGEEGIEKGHGRMTVFACLRLSANLIKPCH